jgi:hypothetical protein
VRPTGDTLNNITEVMDDYLSGRALRGHKSMAKLVDALRALENTNSVDAAEVAA